MIAKVYPNKRSVNTGYYSYMCMQCIAQWPHDIKRPVKVEKVQEHEDTECEICYNIVPKT